MITKTPNGKEFGVKNAAMKPIVDGIHDSNIPSHANPAYMNNLSLSWEYFDIILILIRMLTETKNSLIEQIIKSFGGIYIINYLDKGKYKDSY